jgi:hypothetical protein
MPFVGLVGIRSLLRRPASEASHTCLNFTCSLSAKLLFLQSLAHYLSNTFSACRTQCTNMRRCRSNRVYTIRLSLFRQVISFTSVVSSSMPQSENSHQARKIDVVFLSPPWGGPSYLAGHGTPKKGPRDDDEVSWAKEKKAFFFCSFHSFCC